MNKFEEELSFFLQNTLEDLSDFEGVAQRKKNKLQSFIAEGNKDLSSLAQTYSDFVEERKELHLEEILHSQINVAEFITANVPLYAMPHLYQQLPRYSNGDGTSLDEIKCPFTSLATLKRHIIDKAVLSLYETVSAPKDKKIVLFTYVMEDGLGDFIAQRQALSILKEEFADIQCIVLAPSQYKLHMQTSAVGSLIHYYESKERLHFTHFSEDICMALSEASFLLQIPSFYPYFDQLLQKYEIKEHHTIGEYGFIDSSWAHPMKTDTCCMGLHFLERGIFIKQMPSLEKIQLSADVQRKLLGSLSLDKYRKEKSFAFAYLKTLKGMRVFLHMALTYFSADELDLDIAFTDLHDLLLLIKEGRLGIDEYKIKELRISTKDKNYLIPMESQGKVVRFIEMGPLSSDDTKALIVLSQKLVGCTGNQSFSEAVSASSCFFYDAAPHAGPFLQDFLEIAKCRLQEFPKAITFIEGFIKAFHFKEGKACLEEIGKELGTLLLDPETARGLIELNRILQNEYSFNQTLKQIIKRRLFVGMHPEVARNEEILIKDFVEQKDSFTSFFENLRVLLSDNKK